MSKKLYKVTCRGMVNFYGSGITYGVAYVVADNPDEAYRKLRESLEGRNIGFARDRELSTVELLAEAVPYPDCGIRLYD